MVKQKKFPHPPAMSFPMNAGAKLAHRCQLHLLRRWYAVDDTSFITDKHPIENTCRNNFELSLELHVGKIITLRHKIRN